MQVANRRVMILIGLFLAGLILGKVNFKTGAPYLRIDLDGRGFGPEVRALQEGGVTYVNLSFLRQVFNISTAWRQTTGQLYFKFGAAQYTFEVNDKAYVAKAHTSRSQFLEAALMVKNEQLWMPLEFPLRLGLRVRRRTNRQLSLEWQDNYLLGVENSWYQGRPAFVIIGTKAVKLQKYYLRPQPSRLVCELAGISRYPGMAEQYFSNHPGVRQVRVTRQAPKGLSLCFALLQATDIQVIADGRAANRLWIVPDYRIEEVAIAGHGKSQRVIVKASAPAEFQVIKDAKGRPVAVLFEGARNAVLSQQVRWGRSGLRTIKVSQVGPHRVQVSLEQTGREAWAVARSSTNPNWVEITTRPTLPRTKVDHCHQLSLVGKRIVLDPGHGGVDESACGKQDLREKDLNLEIGLRLERLLQQAGATVICTRYADTLVGLYERAALANHHRADLFVSLHANYHPDPRVRGSEVYHYPGRAASRKVAESIIRSLSRKTGLSNRGVRTNDFVVIRETAMPSILVELGFLSNYAEEALLQTAALQEQAAWGIFKGIEEYFLKVN